MNDMLESSDTALQVTPLSRSELFLIPSKRDFNCAEDKFKLKIFCCFEYSATIWSRQTRVSLSYHHMQTYKHKHDRHNAWNV